jgi:hypothetical protein
MALVIDVPLNTAIADLDEALRTLLKRELGKHGFEGVDIAFDAPSKEWSGKLTNPTVDLFLYDLREAIDRGRIDMSETRNGNGAISTPPPLRLELTYAVTAWTKAVEDEHRLLSQVLAVLFSYRTVPDDVLDEINSGSRLRDTETSVGRPREEKADFWSAVGGQYKASIDYVVIVTVESGALFTRGPEVRTQTVRTRMSDGPARTMEELHRYGGTVKDGDEQPVADAWVTVPDLGLWTATDRQGRFLFQRVRPGKLSLTVRTLDGGEAEATADVPGPPTDIVVGGKKRAAGKGGVGPKG